MATQRYGTVRLNALDGPRERQFPVPDNWERLTDEQREAVWRPVKDQLMEDAVDFTVVEPEHARMTVGELRTWLAGQPDDRMVVIQNHADSEDECSPVERAVLAVYRPISAIQGEREELPERTPVEADRISVFLVPVL